MRRVALLLTLAALTACEKNNVPNPPPATDAATTPAAPAPIDLAKVAGSWDMKTMPADNDSVLVSYKLTTTADTTGWILALPNRKPMTLKVTVSGDSVITTSPDYESVLRKGVTVHTNSMFRLVGDKLVGTTTAHYSSKGVDSLRVMRAEGVRSPK